MSVDGQANLTTAAIATDEIAPECRCILERSRTPFAELLALTKPNGVNV